jgi:hypothetical protein
MSAEADRTTVWHRLLWVPAFAAPFAAVLFLAGAIGIGAVGLVCGASWWAWFVAMTVFAWRSRGGVPPMPKSVGYSCVLGYAASYGVMWGVTLIE